ncbi:MAG: hypothetical protein HN370_02075 [Phycisphaerales bacterium]|jgi:L-Ala-D/L-Glu epimerase|nr:hypothetical protein [Phycisphaerales bacterium]
MEPKVQQLELFRTSIPMRGFDHAAARRVKAESLLAKFTFSDGSVAWGETLPREYVTGESFGSVVSDVTDYLWPLCCEAGLLDGESTEPLPLEHDGRLISAASALVETARASRVLAKCPPQKITARVSGILGSADPAKTAKRLRMMWLGGLRDFKLKLGFGEDIDRENLHIVRQKIHRAIHRRKASLRVDVNGGWDAGEVAPRTEELHREYGVCCVEQPVFCDTETFLMAARACAVPLMADESLRTWDEAQMLLAEPAHVAWNVRLSKCGGAGPVMRLLTEAAERGVMVSFGCMVGETSILSALQRRVLMCAPQPRFVEGNWGKLLLKDDITKKSLRFGLGGRLRAIKGIGYEIDTDKLAYYAKPLATLKR